MYICESPGLLAGLFVESEMLKRGMIFEVIDWSEDQARLPFEE
jgi:hypothetical protein